MGLVDRLKAIIDVMPDGGSVSLPVTWLRDLLDAEGDSPGIVIDDPLTRHKELLAVLEDETIHDVTAYLETLK